MNPPDRSLTAADFTDTTAFRKDSDGLELGAPAAHPAHPPAAGAFGRAARRLVRVRASRRERREHPRHLLRAALRADGRRRDVSREDQLLAHRLALLAPELQD